MSSNVNSALILPGSTMNFFCKDGLSPLDVNHIQQVFNFGGNIKLVNCGVENTWVAFQEAQVDMNAEVKKAKLGND